MTIITSAANICGNIIVVVLIGHAVQNILYQYEENRCVMTWMYDYPQYLKVTMNDTVQEDFPKYSLFIYGEATYAEYLVKMKGNYKLEGIPVVFVHGNAGRYKQVRSPGSVSLTKSESKQFHFNYFSVDYEEELSALHGPYLERQTKFLHHALLRILQCYNHLEREKRPTSVIAIGHSMGGIVIRGLYSIPTFDGSLLSVIVNLATPQKYPTILLDEHISSFYKKVNGIWIAESFRKFENITFLSLGGGFRDYLVRSDLCLFDSLSSNRKHFSSLTTALPTIWLENDHQCIVWCNQLVRALTRAFFNMIDKETRQITSDSDFRAAVLSRTLYFQNMKRKSFKGDVQQCQKVDSKQTPIMLNTTGCYQLSSIVSESYVLNVWAFTARQGWFYHCSNATSKCVSGDTHMFLPGNPTSQFHQFTSAPLMSSSEFFLLKTQPDERYLVMETLLKENIELSMDVPYFLLPNTKTFEHVNKVFFTSVNMIGLTDPWQTYNVTVTLNPTTKTSGSTVIKIKPAWSNESNVYSYSHGEKIQFPLKLFVGISSSVNGSIQNHSMKVYIWREEISRVTIQIQPSILDSLGQILRFNVDSFVRYSLIFHLFQSTVKEMNLAQHSFVYVTLRLCHMAVFTPRLFVIHHGFIKIVLPQMFLLMSAYVVANMFQLVSRVFLAVASFVIFLPRKIAASTLPKVVPTKNNGYTKMAISSSIIVVLACTYSYHGESCCLVLLLLIHLASLLLLPVEYQGNASMGTFCAVLPITLLFIAVPLIVHVKDILNGFDHQLSNFTNLTVLAIGYTACLMFVKDEVKDVKIAGRLYPALLLVFMFDDLVELYNVTHLLVIYFCFSITTLRR